MCAGEAASAEGAGKGGGTHGVARMDCENNPERLHQVDGPIDARLPSTSWVEDAADCVESPCRSRVGSDALDLTPPALGAACSYYVAGWSDQHTPRATRADAPPQKSEVPLLSLFPSLPLSLLLALSRALFCSASMCTCKYRPCKPHSCTPTDADTQRFTGQGK